MSDIIAYASTPSHYRRSLPRAMLTNEEGPDKPGLPLRNEANRSAKRDLLNAQIGNFADQQRIVRLAIDGVHRAELVLHSAGLAELSDHRSVQAHFVDFACRVDVARRIGVGYIQHLVCARRDANRLRIAQIADLRLERAVGVEHLDAVIVAIGDIDIVLGIDGDAANVVEFTLARA